MSAEVGGYGRAMTPARSQATGHTNGQSTTAKSPIGVVTKFFDHLAEGNVDAAVDMMDVDVSYINVSTPAIRGRERVRRVLKAATRAKTAAFEVYIHAISEEGGVVLTERTDVLIWGPMRAQIWVCGRFDIRDGTIVLWKDYFDWVNFTLAVLRGLVGIVVPGLRAKAPATA